ncbi:molybdopterin molybdotransferase MoeA [Mucilaginibacter auburnensis]|uniref:Molybdopterin molybdenumtransferase n=1 Tax=Mucilaginibacter auburnensis TaxID=1457233 RepID=A0A2H9VVY4_9SPHI|nr:molybdopterin molybdotransferase MoeA [Mucilaginibacter auburnensis]PJJ84980.1 molybdopterin molybdotransferase [Mucilaginibacter auburnensis]
MITVEQAEKLILANAGDYGNEIISFDGSLGRVLAETIKSDRDLPPFNRVSMDGIAIKYEAFANGQRTFTIKATQAAGDTPIDIDTQNECVEIMTGAALPESLDTVVRYEDITIEDEKATVVLNELRKGQNLHLQGADRKKGDIVLTPGRLITPAVLNMLASVGEVEVRVKRKPRVVILSSGNELVEADKTPSPFQIRRSNNYMVRAVLDQLGIDAAMLHLPDEPTVIKQTLQQCLYNFDVLLLSGGISMGKFDYIPEVLNELRVEQIFHKVQQRPGKPFWFGKQAEGPVVFAFPGNPVATFMCVQRYFVPWLNKTLSVDERTSKYAVLDRDLKFEPELKYFLQVQLTSSAEGVLLAMPVEGNGSGDFANLADTDAFMELPLEKKEFKKGEVYKIWQFNIL